MSADAGVVLSDVAPGGPAARAGLEPGDLVLALDGKRMENGRQLRNQPVRAWRQRHSGPRRPARRSQVEHSRVPVGERDSDAARLSDLVAQQVPVRALGVLALTLTPKIVELLPDLRRQKGVVVATVSQQVPYSQQGRLQPGDVIYSLNGKTIETVADLNAAAAQFKPGAAVVLHLERAGTLCLSRVQGGEMTQSSSRQSAVVSHSRQSGSSVFSRSQPCSVPVISPSLQSSSQSGSSSPAAELLTAGKRGLRLGTATGDCDGDCDWRLRLGTDDSD